MKTFCHDRPMTVLEALEEQMQKNAREAAPESPFIRRIRLVGDWLIDKTENSNGEEHSDPCFTFLPKSLSTLSDYTYTLMSKVGSLSVPGMYGDGLVI